MFSSTGLPSLDGSAGLRPDPSGCCPLRGEHCSNPPPHYFRCRARPQTWKIWHKMPKYVGCHILVQRLFFNKRKRGTFNIYLLALPRTYKFASKGISSLRLGPLSVSPRSCFNVFSMSVRPSLLEHPLCHRGFSENCIVRSVKPAAAY